MPTPQDDHHDGDGLSTKTVLAIMATGFVSTFFAIVIDSLLYMIAKKPLFAVLYTLTIFLAGGGLFLRTNNISGNVAAGSHWMVHLLRIGSICTFLSGISVFVVAYTHFGSFVDIIFLVSVASGAAFALGFALCDFYNKFFRHGSEFHGRQVRVLALSTVLLGGVTGFLFASVDIEDHAARFSWELWMESIVGFLAGCIIGYVNHTSVDENLLITFDPLPMEDGPAAVGGGGDDLVAIE